jgi:hypothetical protein
VVEHGGHALDGLLDGGVAGGGGGGETHPQLNIQGEAEQRPAGTYT